jgi:UDP-N-acetylmuramate--alanine ligase
MIDLKNIANVYFIGVGGIGMSGLARYFNHHGKKVAGYDLNSTSLTLQLEKEGINIHYTDDLSLVPTEFKKSDSTLIVFTPAIPSHHSELNWFKKEGFQILKRAEVLGMITNQTKAIAIAGTHGKTTTSTMIAHLLTESGVGCNAFLGGIAVNYDSNVLYSDSPYTVVEADEYDRSFLRLFPEYAVITSMDADHLEIYGNKEEMVKTYLQFASQVKTKLVTKKELNVSHNSTHIEYSILGNANVYAENIRVENGAYHYSIISDSGKIENVTLGLAGRHNVENSLAAVAVAQSVGIDNEKIKKSLASFRGVKRRFETIVKNDKTVFIDDYAHHPEELRACISSARELYAGKKLTGIFQPHLFSRTKDFAKEFAESLDLLDEIILLDIYPARELPMEGVTSELLLGKMKKSDKRILSKEKCLMYISENRPQVLLTMGAGDIDKMIMPIAEILK